jgi:hypothetical protein
MYEQILSVALAGDLAGAIGELAGYVIFAVLCVGIWRAVKHWVKKAKQ